VRACAICEPWAGVGAIRRANRSIARPAGRPSPWIITRLPHGPLFGVRISAGAAATRSAPSAAIVTTRVATMTSKRTNSKRGMKGRAVLSCVVMFPFSWFRCGSGLAGRMRWRTIPNLAAVAPLPPRIARIPLDTEVLLRSDAGGRGDVPTPPGELYRAGVGATRPTGAAASTAGRDRCPIR
jgi:hypothetical protein